MKKSLFLLILAAMLLPLSAGAQLLAPKHQVQRPPVALKAFSQRFMAPARANLADNQMILGHYDTDDVATAEGGLGITGLPGVIPIATVLSPDQLAMFQGGKIVKFRVGLANATAITRVFVAPLTSMSSIGAFTEWECNVSAAGWNEIELETPYDINLESNQSLMIGFDYKQTSSNYPISAVMQGAIKPTYILYNGSWEDVGLSNYGNLSVQCIVESDHFPDYLIGVSNLVTDNFVKTGDNIEFTFASRNMAAVSNIPAGSVTYSLFIDGQPVGTIENEVALGRTDVNLTGAITSDGLDVGKHILTVTVNTLNGEPVEEPFSVSRTFTIYDQSFPHQMHMLEQFTSTYCTYCPLGSSMLSVLTGMRDDIVWVGIHGNMQGTDPMRTLQCDTIMAYQGSDSYPSASFDRSTGWDSDVTITTGIGYYADYHQAIAEELNSFYDYLDAVPAFATVNINSTVDPETRDATITVDGELTPDFDLMMGADSKLNVYITEDSVVARQLNQGRWVAGYVHNGVLRRALNSAKGNDLKRDGNTYKNEFTYNIPTSWRLDKLYVVAFISRPLQNGLSGVYTDMYVNQANKRKLGESDAPALRGDADGNGVVNITDAILIVSHLLGDPAPIYDGADCDFNGQVNVSDASMLINYVLTNQWPD